MSPRQANDGGIGHRPACALVLLTLALCALVLALFLMPEPTAVQGSPHPRFDAMQRGGDATQQHLGVLAVGWLFGALQIALFSGLVAFGARKGSSLRGLLRPLLWGTAAYLVVWSLLVLAYRGAWTSPGALILSFPPPTAVMLFLLWPLPAFYVWLYISGFRRWILTDEDLEQFQRLLVRSRRASDDGERPPRRS